MRSYWAEETGLLLHELPANMRSYTGHEPVTFGGDNRIIHMNGRIYDADTGRFMQADPFVQAPTNLQNYNAYSYVLNNPLSYTDPSGYLFKKLGKFIKKNWRTIAAIGILAVTGYGVDLFTAFEAYGAAATIAATGGALAGYVATGSAKGAVMGALSGAAFYGIGQAFGASSGFLKTGGIGHLGSHALAGGIMAELQGGNFGHGFWSAGITKGAQIGRLVPSNLAAGTIASAVIGGTVSHITGGKFGNGATTAAFQFTLNHFVNDSKYPFSKEAQMDESHPIPDEILELYEQYQEGKFKSLVGVNKAAGESAEEYVASILREKGYIVLVKGVTLKVDGSIRYPDLTLFDGRTEELVSFMEVKLNNSRLISRQIRNDKIIQTKGAMVTRTPSPTLLPQGEIGKTNVELFRIYYQDQD
ncbi:RHS repeat protein [Pseudoalteromonas rubra]|uniref:Uncharacterized protein n=1 Tax=Pseudoalteromonas rubra TaxID=43658 RepID=A0A0U3HM86_9GAMM|nr:RHS repeat-associated core domain-containing protein [Pseudoalteromonas rubra]ALU44085.1 hypothetical protein AT705_14705 [Pseudoalteromonas rubra]